jgi:hypothetical protein
MIWVTVQGIRPAVRDWEWPTLCKKRKGWATRLSVCLKA